MKRGYGVLAFAFLLVGGVAYAGDGTSPAFPFSRIDMNSATAGMAGAGMATSQLAWGAHSNPSTMVFSPAIFDVQAGWQNWMPRVNGSANINAAAGYNGGRFALSFAAAYLGGKPYDVISSTGAINGSFNPSDMEASFGGAFRVGKNLSVGINANMMSSSLAPNHKIVGFSAGLFAAYRDDAFTVSGGMKGLGPKVDKQYRLPSSVAVAAGYSLGLGDNVLLLDADFDYYLAGGMSVAAGAEMSFRDMAFLRAGYRFSTSGTPVPSFASVGIGANLAGARLNFAYFLASESVGGSLVLGVGYCF